jgi:glycosyltransferase involved in cell wall biosynthesis
VISTKNLGSADIVEDHRAGVIVPDPHDVDALAMALDRLPRDGPECAALQARARKAAEGLPGDAFIEKLLQLYASCIAAKQERPS